MAVEVLDENEELELWREFKKTKSIAIRDKLIRQYMPLVKWVAGRVSTGMPDSVEFDDLVGFGQFGLLDAIEKYDPDKNVTSFEHRSALMTVTQLVENALRSAFGAKTEYLTLVCLTASTQRKTELRYKEFAEQLCKNLNMNNAYPHIQVIEGGSAKHDGGNGSRRVSYDQYFFNGKYVVLFDDVRTTGHSLEQERRTMEKLGAKVICAVTIAQTTY